MKRSGENVQKDPDRGAEIAKLKAIKGALKEALSSMDVRAIHDLLSQIDDIASDIPSEILAELGLSSADVETYKEQLVKIEREIVEAQGKDTGKDIVLTSEEKPGERAAERVMANVIEINKRLEDYLNRDDIKASRERKKRWLADPESRDPVAIVDSLRQEKHEQGKAVKDYLESSVDTEAMEKERMRLVLEHGSEAHEVVAFEVRVGEVLTKDIEVGERLKKDVSSSRELLKDPKVVAVMGEEEASAEIKDREVKEDKVQQKLAKMEALLARQQARLDAKAMKQKETHSPLSPNPTPNPLHTPPEGRVK